MSSSILQFRALKLAQSSINRATISTIPRYTRSYATSDPDLRPLKDNAPPKEVKTGINSWFIYGGLGVAAVYGYYLFVSPESLGALKPYAKEKDKEIEKKSKELLDATKAAGKDEVASIRSRVDTAAKDAETRVRKVADDAQAKVDSYKSSAQKSLSDARESTEDLYKEAKAIAERKTAEAENKAKQGWFSWLGWGKSKIDDGKKEVVATADEVKSKIDKA